MYLLICYTCTFAHIYLCFDFLLSAVSLNLDCHSYHLLCVYVLITQNIANYIATCMIAYVVT